MTAALILEPHQDDTCLFAAFTAIRESAHVVTVLKSKVQEKYGITSPQRELENGRAFVELGLDPFDGWEQWPYLDDSPDWQAVETAMGMIGERLEPEAVYAPAVEDGGHEHHSRVGEMARSVFGRDRVTHYTTYRRGFGRTVGPVEVVPEPDWIVRKLRALACFESQIREPSTRPWFLDGLREWHAE